MEDNKNPKGAARSAAPLGRRRRRRLVVFHLVRISYVFGAFPGPCWASTGPAPYENYGTGQPPTLIQALTVGLAIAWVAYPWGVRMVI